MLKHLRIALTFLSRVLLPWDFLRSLDFLLNVLTCSLHIEQFAHVTLSGLALPKAIPSVAVFA